MSIRTMDWKGQLGKKVRVYRNLNNGRISVQAQIEGRWLVVGHVTDLVLESVSFSIRESGRLRVLREGQKNVHAFACGRLIAQAWPELDCPIDLAYDPYRNTTFVERNSQRSILQCRYLVVRSNRVTVSPDAMNLTPFNSRFKPNRATPAQIKQMPLFWKSLWVSERIA